MRSKRNVVLVIVGVVVLLFAVGVVYRVFRPSPVGRAVRDLPSYPGAREVDASQSGLWTSYAQPGSAQGDARVFSYLLPRGVTAGTVRRYYAARVPSSWRRVNQRCFDAGRGVRVLLLAVPPRLDVLVAEKARCV